MLEGDAMRLRMAKDMKTARLFKAWGLGSRVFKRKWRSGSKCYNKKRGYTGIIRQDPPPFS